MLDLSTLLYKKIELKINDGVTMKACLPSQVES